MKNKYKMTEAHKTAIGLALMGHGTSKETREKIGNANSSNFFCKCDFCKKTFKTTPSAYNKKKRHFCSRKCYAGFIINLDDFTKMNAYRGIRKKGQTKQIYYNGYCKRHPNRIAHLKARRYAREKGAIGKHSLEQWENLKIEHDNRCAFCRGKKKLTKDHIIPLSEGGTDYIDNIQPLCRSCNSKKWKHRHSNPELIKETK